MGKDSKVLFGLDKICRYLGVSKNTFMRLVENEGLPAMKGIGGWRAHTDLLDQHMKHIIEKKAMSREK